MARCHAPNNHPPFHELILVALASLLSSFLAGCAPEQSAVTEQVPADTYFPIQLGDKSLELQLALTPAERQMGLMFRNELGQNSGMLFLFEKPDKRGFWMKNTRIHLDIGYFDTSGKLLEIHHLYPFDETPVPSRSDQILIAVETNLGWFKINGIQPGARLDIEALKVALSKRGVNPSSFAISD